MVIENLGLSWAYDAACRDLWAVFDMASPQYDEQRAKLICSTCPVFAECRVEADALELINNAAPMIIAGQTPRERRARRSRQRGRGRTSDRIRALGPLGVSTPPPPPLREPLEAKPWQERRPMRGVDPAKLSGSERGFVSAQVEMMTGLTARQLRSLAEYGIGSAPKASGDPRRWSVGEIDLLRAFKDRLDDGASMQRAKADLLPLRDETR